MVCVLKVATWSLLNTDSFETAILKAVNLGVDTDSVKVVTGRFATLYYGFDGISGEWIESICYG